LSVDNSGFIRVAIPAKFNWRPGQHCFLRFTSLGLQHAISSHPFTICSLPSMQPGDQNELVFYVRPHGGFTAKLRTQALENPGSSIPVLVDGPYGGINMSRYTDVDNILVVAGGSGAGWCLPLIEQFVRHGPHSQSTHMSHKDPSDIEKDIPSDRSTRPTSLRLVLATRDTASRRWFLEAVEEILARYHTTSVSSGVRVQVYLTGEAAREAGSPEQISEDVSKPSVLSLVGNRMVISEEEHHGTVTGSEFEGRPLLSSIVKEEAQTLTGGRQLLSVFACGPATMQNDVRNAVAAANIEILRGSLAGGVYLYTEHFSWA
jgi:NAD(P)H-flavin reductase